MKRNPFWIVLLLAAASFPGLAAERRWTADLESGSVFSGYNDVRIPNFGGTLFSLSRDLDLPGRPFARLRLSYALGGRHELSALFAPLTLKASGSLPTAVAFQGADFPPGAAVEGIYKFNSYRLTYRYALIKKPRLRLDIGLTAKIRDAKIALDSGTTFAEKTDLGFVPLLHLRLDWRWRGRLGLLVEADAAASPGGEGRAEDILVALQARLNGRLSLRFGYRMVEGGADVEPVYNFAWLHYLAAGLSWRL
jgi:hypothetical protein